MATPIVRVANVMRTSMHMVDGLDSVESALAAMSRLGVSSLIIERRNDDDEYGVVTVRDIAERVISLNRSAERTSVYEVMTKPALTLAGEMNVKYAVRLLARLGASRALVTGAGGIVGFVTLRDLVLAHVKPEGGGE